jgi:hypothetical protein
MKVKHIAITMWFILYLISAVGWFIHGDREVGKMFIIMSAVVLAALGAWGLYLLIKHWNKKII